MPPTVAASGASRKHGDATATSRVGYLPLADSAVTSIRGGGAAATTPTAVDATHIAIAERASRRQRWWSARGGHVVPL